MEMVKNTEDELHHPTNRSPESNHTLQMLDSNFVSIQCLLHLQVRHLNFHWGQESLAQAESFGHHWRGHHSRKGRGLGLGCVGFDRCCERIQKLSYFCLHKSLVENEFLDCWFVIFQYLGPRVIFYFQRKATKRLTQWMTYYFTISNTSSKTSWHHQNVYKSCAIVFLAFWLLPMVRVRYFCQRRSRSIRSISTDNAAAPNGQ